MKWVIGIDEVGRGPLAGPIAVGALAMPAPLNVWEEWQGLKDSKKLTEKKRDEWYEKIRTDTRLRFQVSSSSALLIDSHGIVLAARVASDRALERLNLAPDSAQVLLDYGLNVADEWAQEQFVRGDEQIPVIALASICAKVERDRYMIALAADYPDYGFEKHKGYGTKQHQDAIRTHGPIQGIHRPLFLRSLLGNGKTVS